VVLRSPACSGHTVSRLVLSLVYLPEEEAVIVVMVTRLDADDQSKSTALFLVVMEALYPEYVDTGRG
jgi:hypothetical protein